MRTFLLVLCVLARTLTFAQSEKPFRIAIAGLTHDHAHGILSRADDGDLEIVGIAEADKALYDRYMQRYRLSIPRFNTLDELLDETRPEAVAAFTSIYGHLDVVKACAPRKIPVMVEKPLAVNRTHAREMETLARKNGIVLLTNYETTWYASHYALRDMQPQLGDIRKIVVHDGHSGPKEIGCSKEFLSWLTDPIQNGGGAVVDFGCYGANLSTWLMNGARPVSVSAVLQTIKPDIYPKVDDEATIVLTYPHAQAIIQASWNWPFSRKDIEVYGKSGYAFADRKLVRYRYPPNETEQSQVTEKPFNDPFAYFAGVVRGTIKVSPNDLSSLENNLIVVEILDAARESARTGKAVKLN